MNVLEFKITEFGIYSIIFSILLIISWIIYYWYIKNK